MISMEVPLKPQLAESDCVGDSMYRDDLQMSELGTAPILSGVQDGEPMRRDASYDTLEQMSLESLLYHVLAGDGKRVKESERT